MRRTLRSGLFSAALFSLTITVSAQDRFAFAITDANKDGSSWNSLRKFNLQTGEYADVLLNGTDGKTVVFDATTRQQVTLPADAKYGNLFQAPFSTGVAAAAYDRRNNRLYFTPMFIDQLRYIDLKSGKVFYVTDQAFTRLGNMHNNSGHCITRMVITPDGTGYAVSNDGKTFIRFTTGKKLTITQLGSLVDDSENGSVSIHNTCSSQGGDMISDDNGNLYIISARNHVFKVNTETKVAKHLGAIEGLPAKFTVNGAVVDAEGNLLVSSAVYGDSYFVVNPKNWSASAYQGAKVVFRSSDLANSNYLGSSKFTTIETIARTPLIYNQYVQVYPNPVVANQFTMQFGKVPSGDYTMELVDVMGRSIMARRISIAAEDQTETISLRSTNAKGIYLIKLMDRANKAVYEQKLMIQ